MNIVKYLLFAFNLIFVIFGILLIYFGVDLIKPFSHWESIIKGDPPSNSAVTLIVIGCVIFLIAFLGCCGALRENHCMLVTFGGIILVLLLVELIGAGLILGYRSQVKIAVQGGIDDAMGKYNMTNPNATVNQVIDDLQYTLKCCGANETTDWDRQPHHDIGIYPESCCGRLEKSSNITCKIADVRKANQDVGCVGKLENDIKNALGVLGGIAIAIALIQLIGVVFACCLGRSIRREYEVV